MPVDEMYVHFVAKKSRTRAKKSEKERKREREERWLDR